MAGRDEVADVVIVGSGATGAIAAMVLGQAGLNVVCLEQGGWVEDRDHPHYHGDWQWQRKTRWSPDVNVRRGNPDDFPVRSDSSQVLMWNGVGGSTNVYGALWPRYRPSDFRKGTEHGLEGTIDWPKTLTAMWKIGYTGRWMFEVADHGDAGDVLKRTVGARTRLQAILDGLSEPLVFDER